MIKSYHIIDTVAQAREYLNTKNNRLSRELQSLNRIVLDDKRFQLWPASTSKHQAFVGGLVMHTAQVVYTALDIIKSVPAADPFVIIVAGIWHDYAKILDYIPDTNSEYNETNLAHITWKKTDFRILERHLARSYADFRHHAILADLDSVFVDTVSHVILAHHGRLEYGSPVEPQTAEAWALHSADMLSARFVDGG